MSSKTLKSSWGLPHPVGAGKRPKVPCGIKELLKKGHFVSVGSPLRANYAVSKTVPSMFSALHHTNKFNKFFSPIEIISNPFFQSHDLLFLVVSYSAIPVANIFGYRWTAVIFVASIIQTQLNIVLLWVSLIAFIIVAPNPEHFMVVLVR